MIHSILLGNLWETECLHIPEKVIRVVCHRRQTEVVLITKRKKITSMKMIVNVSCSLLNSLVSVLQSGFNVVKLDLIKKVRNKHQPNVVG